METENQISRADIDAIIAPFRGRKGILIPLLQKMQERFGYVPRESIEPIAEAAGVFPVEVYGILTFYAQFYLEPRGRHTIRVCQGTACYIMGGKDILDHVCGKLGVQVEETTKDNRFTIERVACLGCCSLAPVMMIDEETYGRLDEKAVRKIVKDYRTES